MNQRINLHKLITFSMAVFFLNCGKKKNQKTEFIDNYPRSELAECYSSKHEELGGMLNPGKRSHQLIIFINNEKNTANLFEEIYKEEVTALENKNFFVFKKRELDLNIQEKKIIIAKILKEKTEQFPKELQFQDCYGIAGGIRIHNGSSFLLRDVNGNLSAKLKTSNYNYREIFFSPKNKEDCSDLKKTFKNNWSAKKNSTDTTSD